MKKITLALAAVVLSSLSGSRAEAVPSVNQFNAIVPPPNPWVTDPWMGISPWHWILGDPCDPAVFGVTTDFEVSPLPIALDFQISATGLNFGTATSMTAFGPASLTLNGMSYLARTPGSLPLNELGEFDPEGTTIDITAGTLIYDIPVGFMGGSSGMLDFSLNPLSLTVPSGQPFGVWNQATLGIEYNFMASTGLFLGDFDASFMLAFANIQIVPTPASAMVLLAPCAFLRRRRR